MSSPFLRRTKALICLLSLCVCSAHSQQIQAAAKKGSYRIAGKVVSALDGHPLPGATISVSEVTNGPMEQSVISGDGGVFVFDGLPAGKHSLRGQIRGFVPANYDQHELFSTAIVTGAGVDTESLILRLQPAGTIEGRVLDELGEPVRDAQVTLYREGFSEGRSEIKTVTATQTDTLGEYVAGQLQEGKYFIGVKAVPWYAVNPGPPDANGSPILTGVDPALDVVYPLTFYGDVTKPDAATPVLLKPGERFRAEIRVAPLRAVKITVQSAPGTQPGGMVMLRTPVFDGFDQLMLPIQQAADGTGLVTGLAPATYRVQTTDPTGNGARSGRLDLSQGSVTMDASGAEAQGSMVLRIEGEDGEKIPGQSLVLLRGIAPGNPLQQIFDLEGKATFNGLAADDYHFLVVNSNHLLQTVRIDEGEKHLAQSHYHLAAWESASLTLVVAGTAKAIEGLALHEGKPMAGAMIVLAPIDAMENVDLYRRDQSDQDGTFALLDVPAGRYIVVAIADGWKLEWGRPEVLTRFLAKGAAVEIPSSARKSVRLTTPILVQDR